MDAPLQRQARDGLSEQARAVIEALLPLPSRSADEERDRRLAYLAVGCRLFGRHGFDNGVAGHMSARDPEDADRFWVNPVGRPFSMMRVSDLLLVDASGAVVKGDGQVNLAAFAIHSAVHRARPDVVSAAHTHSKYGRAWSTLGRLLAPISQDACAFYEDHALFDSYHGPALEASEGEAIAAALGHHKAAVLCNHGLLTVGGSVEEAVWWFLSFEAACEAQLLAESVGSPRPIAPEHAAATARQVGSPEIGRLSFMPYFLEVTTREPDVLR
ncbi:MAG TPA: class II aldolase/adducin family protein [Acidimicrobiales bacterium]|nr:class II aldolase/adducin family protein [Acidimicrobiales bacterium]